MAKLKFIEKRDYILISERNDSDATIFEIENLSAKKMAGVYNIIYETGTPTVNFDIFIKCAELGIVGWKNVLDGDGKEVKFNKDLIKNLNFHAISEIGAEILRISAPEFEESLPVQNEDDEEKKENPLELEQ